MHTILSLFTGAGGLDLGFEKAYFKLLCGVEKNLDCVKTIRKNRDWHILHQDVTNFSPDFDIDLIIAGVPCQGFSVSGLRNPNDPRNNLYQEVVRISSLCKPKMIIIENVLNLRKMGFVPFITSAFEDLGYVVSTHVYKMSNYNVPQTRQRIIFIAFDKPMPPVPALSINTPARAFLEDINHEPDWSWRSKVHEVTGEESIGEPVPIRISRTAANGTPIRNLDQPFITVDRSIFGWAWPPVSATKVNGLWRIKASKIRPFTIREYASLQTFPKDYKFIGNKTSVHKQIGNAVPVNFAEALAKHVKGFL